ncbi:MAG: alpha/beta hydrolase [Ruminococcaceae bacterium]|nr:alpha/beta hydrolase [Oscillospiraceae bacterium]
MINEKIVLGENTRYPLNGLLTLPEGAEKPVPAVVFVHGSGSSNMDEKVGKLTPFRDLAEGLAARGIASVRYDKRTYAHAFRMLRDKSGPITVREETVEDAILAAELLRRDGRIDPGRIFIVGHSMGAMLAPRIHLEGGDFAGLVLMAGTPRRLEEVLMEQSNEALAEMPALLRKLAGGSIRKLGRKFEGLYDLSDEEAKAQRLGGGTTLYYFKEMGQPTVADHLAQVQVPMLVMQGEMDVQVKAGVDFALYRELLGERENVTFRLYPGLNHAFVPALSGKISDAKREFSRERHIPAEVLDDMAAWILVNG